MKLYDSPTEYGPVSRVNHWLGALLVIILLALGIYFHEMPRGDERMFWQRLHTGLGMVAFLPLAFRVTWRAVVRSPHPVAQGRVLQWATRGVHLLLLAAVSVLLLSGPFIVWSVGAPIDLFGVLALPSPMGKWSALHEALETVHAVAGKALLPLIALHVIAALKHALVDRDGTMTRMLGRAA